MTKCRNYNINSICTDTSIESQDKVICSPFDICLPFGVSLHYNGECLSVKGNPTIADGEYGVIVVEGGCITDARPNPIFEYTPPPCTPTVNPCGDSESSLPVLQPGLCNLLTYDAADRLGAFLYVDQGTGITVTGCGTSSNPLVIAAQNTTDNKTYINSGTFDILPLVGSGSLADPYIISHAETPIGPGVYAGFTLDSYGHITNYVDPGDTYIYSVTAGPGIDVNTTGGVATVSLQMSEQEPGTWLMGGYSLTTDVAGRVIDVEQSIALTPGTYDIYNYSFSLNEFGSVTGIVPTQRQTDTSWSLAFFGNRNFTSMQITNTMYGQLRIKYLGDLGTGIASTTGLTPTPTKYQLAIDGVDIQTYARVVGGRIIELHAISSTMYSPGTHSIVLTNNDVPDGEYAFIDNAILDIDLIMVGS